MTETLASRLAVLAVIPIAICMTGSIANGAPTCDRACLLEQVKQFNANMLGHNAEKISLGAGAQIRENTKAIALAESKWYSVKQIRSEGLYTDPIKGNVIEHVAAETVDGKTVYIGTRLKLANKKITEVEINFDDRANVNSKNLIPYDPVLLTIVPPEQRSTREQLEQLITRVLPRADRSQARGGRL